MESMIERQAIRTAVALAAASSHGQSPEAIADLRDEAVQLISMCIHPSAAPEEIRAWCDGASALISRLVSAGGIPDEQVLQVSAAVLRLRLAAARSAVVTEKKSQAAPSAKKVTEEPKPEPVQLNDNLRKLVDFIAAHPDLRVKDLVVAVGGEFSPRTVKRYLAELVALKVVRRTSLPDGGVTYSIRA